MVIAVEYKKKEMLIVKSLFVFFCNMYTVKMFNEQTIWMESTSIFGFKKKKAVEHGTFVIDN